MESRIARRALSILIAGALLASTPLSIAATAKPTAKPVVKASAKATPKKVVTKKRVIKKRKVYTRKVVKISPSPAPAWPPKGFHENSKVYAKVPTSKELIGVLSATKPLTAQVRKCSAYACGAVQVASSSGCTWWEITSTVSGPTSDSDRKLRVLGALRTTAVGTKPKQIVTLLLISTEPLKKGVKVGGINVNCYHSPVTGRVPSNSYLVNTPTPSPLPTISPTPSTSPTPEPTN